MWPPVVAALSQNSVIEALTSQAHLGRLQATHLPGLSTV
jgi:hypothetical protein